MSPTCDDGEGCTFTYDGTHTCNGSPTCYYTCDGTETCENTYSQFPDCGDITTSGHTCDGVTPTCDGASETCVVSPDCFDATEHTSWGKIKKMVE